MRRSYKKHDKLKAEIN